MQKLLLLTMLFLASPVIHAMDTRAQTTQQSSIRSLDDDDVNSGQVYASGESAVEQKENEETLETVIQQFKSAYTTNLVPRLLTEEVIDEETAQQMIADGGTNILMLVKENYHIVRQMIPDKYPSFERFVQQVTSDLLSGNIPATTKQFRSWKKDYLQNNMEAITVAITQEEQSGKMRFLFCKFCEDAQIRTPSTYLMQKLPLVERLLQAHISPNFNAPQYRHNNILQIIFSNPLVTNSMEIISERLYAPILRLVQLLMDHGLFLTNANVDGKNTLDVMITAKESIESQETLRDLSDSTTIANLETVQSVFDQIKEIMLIALHTKNSERQQLFDIVSSSCSLIPETVHPVCDYLGFFDRNPEINLLLSDRYNFSRTRDAHEAEATLE